VRSVASLIQDIRFSTNERDINRFPDERILKFINDAQDQIEAIIITSNFENSPLDKIVTIPFVYNTRIYDLPDDIYAWNSVSQVSFVGGDRIPHGHATDKVLRLFYYITGDKIYFSGDLWADIELIYKAKLPRLLSVSDTPSLPSMCEGFLTSFVERKMQAVNSSSDVNNANVFTKEEKAIITDVFSSNSADISEIPIVRDIYYDDY